MANNEKRKGTEGNRIISNLIMALNEKNTNKLVEYLHILTKTQDKEDQGKEEKPLTTKKEAQEENKPGDIPQAAVLAWWSADAIKINMMDNAVVALSTIDVKNDPDGAVAVIECVKIYIMENIEYLMGHVADLKRALNDLYPRNEIWGENL